MNITHYVVPFISVRVEIVDNGNTSLLEYFASPPQSNAFCQNVHSERVINEIGKCIKAIGDISSILSHDIKSIIASTKMDDQALKEAVNPRMYGSKSIAFPARMIRAIKTRISNLLST